MKIHPLGLALCGVLLTGSFAFAQSPQGITEYQIPTAASGPQSIATGPDGALWFTESNTIGRITTSGTFTEYPLPGQGSDPFAITAGPDGAMWFTEAYHLKIGRITTAGVITEFPLPAGIDIGESPIITGPDGALWFTVGSNIGRMTTAGVFTQYVVPINVNGGLATGTANGITAGPDGAVWFTEDYAGTIGRITTDGVVSQFALPGGPSSVSGLSPEAITAGPDGALWLTELYFYGAGGYTIGRITTGGIFSQYAVPNASQDGGVPGGQSITTGPDGALYFGVRNYVGRMTTAGVLGMYPPPAEAITGASGVNGVTTGPDGAIWFTEFATNKIGRLPITSGSLQMSASPTLPTGAIGGGYFQPIGATGGTLPYTWSVVNGTLSSGLSLSPSGVIAGTPLSAGTQTFTVRVADAASSTVTQAFNLTIGAAGCFYTLSSGGEIFTAAGGSGSIAVSAPAGCAWSVSGAPSSVTITSGSSGSGNETVSFSVAPNFLASPLDATLTIAGIPFTIDQAPAVAEYIFPGFPQPLSFIGAMPHIAAEGGWSTTFMLVNKGAQSAVARTSLFASDGSPVSVPVNLPQQPETSQPLLASALDQTIAPNALFVLQAYGASSVPDVEGSAQLAATGTVDGFAIFHLDPTAQEAVVPIETRNAPSYLLAFDNTNGVATGVALENSSQQPAVISIVLRDDTGAQIGTGLVGLNASGHASFVLSTQYPATTNIRGTVEVDTPTEGRISVLGIRYTQPGMLTTIPAMANVGTAGGSFAHVAAGDGWETTFVLVNTGASAAQATLSFFDDNGNLLPLPLSFPQTNTALASRELSYSANIAAGASLWIEGTGPSMSALTGSAQLATTANISAYAIFRYIPNGQEAVVPLETRNAGAYLIPFDNTNGIATGIAISATSPQAVTVPVIVRDGTGAQIGAGSIPLAANGHLSQLLTTQFPETANIRGTVEFDAPAETTISVLGIRSPPALTFTTLPALAK